MSSLWSRVSLKWDWNAPIKYEGYFASLAGVLGRSVRGPMTVHLALNASPFFRDGTLHPIMTQIFGQMDR